MAGDRGRSQSGRGGAKVIDAPAADLKTLAGRGLTRETLIAIYRNRRTPLVDEYASMRE